MAFNLLIGSPSYSANTTSITPSYPSTWEDGDYLIAHIIRVGLAAAPSSVPTDWSPSAVASEGTSWFCGIYGKAAASADDTTPAWQWAGSTRTKAVIHAVKKASFVSGDPVDVVSNTKYVVNNTVVRAASVTVSGDNSNGLFFGWGGFASEYHFTGPTGWTERFDDYNYDTILQMASKTGIGAGSTGVVDATFGINTVNKHAFMLIFNPLPNTRRRLFNRTPI